MLDSVLKTGSVTLPILLLCLGTALILGIIAAFVYSRKFGCSRSLAMTLALIPLVSSAVIMVVNGNLGAGIAVAGPLSLVRFRSQPGNAKEIVVVFADMAIGLAAATGYIAFTVIFAIVVATLLALFSFTGFVVGREQPMRLLKIDIPEDLNYESVFTDILKKYTSAAELSEVRTTNLGGMYQLRYCITLKAGVSEKDLIDELRTRNGNLPIILGQMIREKGKGEL